jgi:hypothetical protein
MNEITPPMVLWRKWGPTWESMRETAVWLALNGIAYMMEPSGREDIGHAYQNWPKHRLPTMQVYDIDGKLHPVNVGDYLVVTVPAAVDEWENPRNGVRVVPSQEFHAVQLLPPEEMSDATA